MCNGGGDCGWLRIVVDLTVEMWLICYCVFAVVCVCVWREEVKIKLQ